MRAVFNICISGFTQTRGYCHGILKLREFLLANGLGRGVRNRVWYLIWKDNLRQVANDLDIVCNRHGLDPYIGIYGYSYGGWAALQLASELDAKGLTVHSMVLSDPVGRPWFWPRPLPAATSLLGRQWAPRLRVPPNVNRVHCFYQLKNRPQGHILKKANPSTILLYTELGVPHNEMDDHSKFHSQALYEARSLHFRMISDQKASEKEEG